jgi:hypothetical protein
MKNAFAVECYGKHWTLMEFTCGEKHYLSYYSQEYIISKEGNIQWTD